MKQNQKTKINPQADPQMTTQEIQVEEEKGDQDHDPHQELHRIGKQIAKKTFQNSSIHSREQKISPDGPKTSN